MKSLVLSGILGGILAMSGVASAAKITKTCSYKHKSGKAGVIADIEDYAACKEAVVDEVCPDAPGSWVTVTFEVKIKKFPVLPPATETYTTVLDCK